MTNNYFSELSSSHHAATWSAPSRSTTITSCKDVASKSFPTKITVLDQGLDLGAGPDLETSAAAVEIAPSRDQNPVPSLDLAQNLEIDPTQSLVHDPSRDLAQNLRLKIRLLAAASDHPPDQDPGLGLKLPRKSPKRLNVRAGPMTMTILGALEKRIAKATETIKKPLSFPGK